MKKFNVGDFVRMRIAPGGMDNIGFVKSTSNDGEYNIVVHWLKWNCEYAYVARELISIFEDVI